MNAFKKNSHCFQSSIKLKLFVKPDNHSEPHLHKYDNFSWVGHNSNRFGFIPCIWQGPSMPRPTSPLTAATSHPLLPPSMISLILPLGISSTTQPINSNKKFWQVKWLVKFITNWKLLCYEIPCYVTMGFEKWYTPLLFAQCEEIYEF